MCRNCGKPAGRPRAVHCDSCITDTKLVRDVRAELKRVGLPPLGRTVSEGAPMSKKRRQAEAALHRLGKGPNATGSKPGKTEARRPTGSSTARGRATCPRALSVFRRQDCATTALEQKCHPVPRVWRIDDS